MNRPLAKTADGYLVELDRAVVSYLHIDFRFSFDVMNNDGTVVARVVIEQPFQFWKSGNLSTLYPGQACTLAPALGLFNVGIESIELFSIGRLKVRFAGDQRIEVGFSDQYEAWNVQTPGNWIVCIPGGDLALYEDTSGPGFRMPD